MTLFNFKKVLKFVPPYVNMLLYGIDNKGLWKRGWKKDKKKIKFGMGIRFTYSLILTASLVYSGYLYNKTKDINHLKDQSTRLQERIDATGRESVKNLEDLTN